MTQDATKIQALTECCFNYEGALKLAQNKSIVAEKALALSLRQHQKLIRIVINNCKNSDTLLKQAGILP